MSHEEYGKIVHRPCSSCISNVQEITEDFIKFSLSTQTWREIKLSRLSHYTGAIAAQTREPICLRADALFLGTIISYYLNFTISRRRRRSEGG